MKEEWLFQGAVVPVDTETTQALVAEIKRLIDIVGDMALAQSNQVFDPDYNYECDMRKRTLEEVAKAVYDFKAFEKDTMDSFVAYIRGMKR